MMCEQAVVTLRQSHGLLATALEREDAVALSHAMWLLVICSSAVMRFFNIGALINYLYYFLGFPFYIEL